MPPEVQVQCAPGDELACELEMRRKKQNHRLMHVQASCLSHPGLHDATHLSLSRAERWGALCHRLLLPTDCVSHAGQVASLFAADQAQAGGLVAACRQCAASYQPLQHRVRCSRTVKTRRRFAFGTTRLQHRNETELGPNAALARRNVQRLALCRQEFVLHT